MSELSVEHLRAVLLGAGLDPSRVGALGAGESVAGMSGDQWLVAPSGRGQECVVGGVDRAAFVRYDAYETVDLALGALRHLTTTAPHRVEVSGDEAAELARAAVGVARSVVERSGQESGASPADLPVGAAVDRLGHDTGNVTFAYRTPVPMRSIPPTDLDLPYHVYVVRRPLPSSVLQGVAAPWFGQPGGGAMLRFDRCLRWYYDAGFIDEIEVPVQP